MNNQTNSIPPLIIPVILCGGSGTRLWPLSQSQKPKQLLPIVNTTTLLHDTLARIQECLDTSLSNIITITTEDLSAEIVKQLKNFDEDCANHVLSEPSSKNTATAIAYASLYAKNTFGQNAILWIIPSDHYIDDHKGLRSILEISSKNLPSNGILTFGITPTHPETGYGYIETPNTTHKDNSIQKVKNFTEKPNVETAQQYIEAGQHLWNSGMFLARVETIINEYTKHCLPLLSKLDDALNSKTKLNEAYKKNSSLSFDKAIMEKTSNAYVMPCDIGWSDIGSWQNIWDIKSKDVQGNVLKGDIHIEDTEDCLIHSNSLTIAAIGLKDIAIIENENGILVADKKKSAALQKFLRSFTSEKRKENELPLKTVYQKWGTEKIISKNTNYTLKEITLHSGQETNQHYHANGSTHWTLTAGNAVAIINNIEKIINLQGSILIPADTPYMLKNTSDQISRIIEIQYNVILNKENTAASDQNLPQENQES
jgi:mannose-1-phosphate guanylyltransferase/mannose-6-phosphate isomerase